MAKISEAYVAEFKALAAAWLAERNLACDDVKTGGDAWLIASRSGISAICYGDTSRDLPGLEGVHDAHIQTALQAVFPNCVFRDAKRY